MVDTVESGIWTTILIKKDQKIRLDELKVHRREPYWEVLEKLLVKYVEKS